MKLARLMLIALFVLPASAAPQFRPVWSAGALNDIESFSNSEKIVGTHYFYWYSYPDHHFFNDGAHTIDILQDHYPDPESVSFNSAEWHAKQLDDCVKAGLDFIMPVYWGVVDNYFKSDISFSVNGLGPLQWAIEKRRAEGKPSPKIGLFYDTSTLLPGTRGEVGRSEKYDLREEEGKDIFYRTIRDFFYQIEPRNWAAVGGRPLVVLYSSSFAMAHDATLFEYVYDRFQQDFGMRPFIIRDNSWGGNTDGVTQWGAALSGPYINSRVAQVGAGYNDSAVPGRSTPIRERENGNFYRWGWNQILNSTARIVLVETWNEMHEGTSICDSREYGDQYIQLTRHYVDLFKAGEKGTETIELVHPDPVPRPPSTEGSEYKDASAVSVTLGANGSSSGIRLVPGQPDGPVHNAVIGGEGCAQTDEAGTGYMYFSVVDPFYYDQKVTLHVRYTYWDDGFQSHVLEYDSHDSSATLNGAYKAAPRVTCRNTRQWVTKEVTLEDARFVNRENGASDFRFAVINGSMAVRSVEVEKQPPSKINRAESGG
ncbi:MAG: hypothetical protein GC154_17755 [bacterium]|nr:hypothetical protein [bacterium]